jgi:proton glutamate symport protein
MKKILKHPLTILAAVVIGIMIGLYNAKISNAIGIANFAGLIAIPGQIYLFYLQMTVIPIIITAISSSLGNLMRSKASNGLIKRIVAVFLVGIAVTALVGVILGGIGRPGGGLGRENRELLTALISSSAEGTGAGAGLEISLTGMMSDAEVRASGFSTFFTNLIPSNIFSALSQGSTMAVVFFSIVFGIAIGFVKDDSALLLINWLTAFFEAFQKLVASSLYLLPFGLICLMAGQIAQVGVQVFLAMSKFIILYAVGTLILFILGTIIIWIRSGIKNPFTVLSILFEPMMLAFATRNSMATLPSSINCLEKKMHFDAPSVNLTLPMGMTLGRFGNIFYFGIAVFFVAQIYEADLTFVNYIMIFFGIMLAGTATAGASGIVTLSVISIALSPLSLPSEAVLVIFMAIDPIIDPFRTFLLVYANIAATTVVAERDGAEVAKDALLVSVTRDKDLKPILYHDGAGAWCGFEIDMLEEIARSLGKRLVIQKDTAAADIVAGCVVKTGNPPAGFTFSQSYVQIKVNNEKKNLCFLLPDNQAKNSEIEKIIKTLNTGKYLQQRIGKSV